MKFKIHDFTPGLLTTSMRYIVDPKFRGAVERHLAQEREMISPKRNGLLENSQLKKP
jgi:predicted N-acyltransferase